MPVPDVTERFSGTINEVTIGATSEEGGSREKTVTIGGETGLPMLGFEAEYPHPPALALEVCTAGVESWEEWQAFLAARGFTDWRDAIDRGGDRFLTTTSHHPNRDFSGSAAEREAKRATPHP